MTEINHFKSSINSHSSNDAALLPNAVRAFSNHKVHRQQSPSATSLNISTSRLKCIQIVPGPSLSSADALCLAKKSETAQEAAAPAAAPAHATVKTTTIKHLIFTWSTVFFSQYTLAIARSTSWYQRTCTRIEAPSRTVGWRIRDSRGEATPLRPRLKLGTEIKLKTAGLLILECWFGELLSDAKRRHSRRNCILLKV